MARLSPSTILGVLLVLGGAFLLAQSLGIVAVTSHAAWSVMFVAAGLAFLSLLVARRGEWWPAIPGLVSLGIGSLIALQEYAPGLARNWGGSLFLGMIGAAFVVVYLVRPSNWWAMIPAGTMLSLAATAAVAPAGRGQEGGAIFLIGLGLTFLLVYLVPSPRGRTSWAMIPAAVLLVLGALAGSSSAYGLNVVWPVILVAAGAYLMLRAARQNRV